MTTTTEAQDKGRDDVVPVLRKLMPVRPLAHWEHLVIAEQQAIRLHELLGEAGPAADLRWMTQLSRVTVVLLPRWRSGGATGITTFKDGHWSIGINRASRTLGNASPWLRSSSTTWTGRATPSPTAASVRISES